MRSDEPRPGGRHERRHARRGDRLEPPGLVHRRMVLRKAHVDVLRVAKQGDGDARIKDLLEDERALNQHDTAPSSEICHECRSNVERERKTCRCEQDRPN